MKSLDEIALERALDAIRKAYEKNGADQLDQLATWETREIYEDALRAAFTAKEQKT